MYLDQRNFDLIKQFLYKQGLSNISLYKEKYLISHLTIRMKQRNCNSFEDYYNTISSNQTSYFRVPIYGIRLLHLTKVQIFC